MPSKKRIQRLRSRKTANEKPGPMTPATVPGNPADRPIGPPGRNLQDRLDEALEESFPSSDPPSTRIEGPI